MACGKIASLARPPFSKPIGFMYFDLWHSDGRTREHGAFMGGADFVQWHGNYPMLRKAVELRSMAAKLRREHGRENDAGGFVRSFRSKDSRS